MESRRLKSICLVFENCEDYTIPIEYINWWYADEIVDFWYKNNNLIDQVKRTNDFYIKIHKDANIRSNYNEHMSIYTQELPFERIITHPDITQVHFEFTDDTSIWLFVKGFEDNVSVNEYQHSTINGDFLEIKIK